MLNFYHRFGTSCYNQKYIAFSLKSGRRKYYTDLPILVRVLQVDFEDLVHFSHVMSSPMFQRVSASFCSLSFLRITSYPRKRV